MREIRRLNSNEAIILWEKFVYEYLDLVPVSFNPSLFHFYENHFKWKPYYLFIYCEEELHSILPLINTGNAWVSLPHFTYGGFLVLQTKSSINYTSLLESIINNLKGKSFGFYTINIDNLEYNLTPQKVFVRSLSREIKGIQSEKTTSLLFLKNNVEENWKSINPNLRRKINKAISSNLSIKKGGKELIDDFYNVYVKNISKLNSLNYSKKFFKSLLKEWKNGHCYLMVVYRNKVPIGAAMMVSYLGFYENIYFATNIDTRKLYVSDYLHWNLICSCIEQYKVDNLDKEAPLVYSFGRSTLNSGVFKYKNHWPVKNIPLYLHSNYSDLREQNWLYRVWGLVPERLRAIVGPILIRHIY